MTPGTFDHVDILIVEAWGRHVGTLTTSPRGHVFQYTDAWADGPVELAPVSTPNAARMSSWPRSGEGDAFRRLPLPPPSPFIADSLPDSYGDSVMDAYLAVRGMTRDQLTPLDRLTYVGDRGLGALTFRPARPRMPDSLLVEHEDVGHFLVDRFDRAADGARLHVQTLAAVTGLNSDDPRGYEYTVYLNAASTLRLPSSDLREAFRRVVFNVLAHVRDDHIKNFAFLCDPTGRWTLAPAYELTYSPKSKVHATHVLGKATDINDSDLLELGVVHGVPHVGQIVEEVRYAVDRWEDFASSSHVPPRDRDIVDAALT